MGTERWKRVAGHPNYKISNFGRVRSRSRWLVDKLGRRRFWRRRILTAHKGRPGYLCIVLDGNNYWVHKLVARAFIPNPENKRCVNHKDGNKRNNQVGNLEWSTHAENMAHALESGLFDSIRGSKHYAAKLHELDIPKIRRMTERLSKTMSLTKACAKVSNKFGVSSGTVKNIYQGKSWKHVPK